MEEDFYTEKKTLSGFDLAQELYEIAGGNLDKLFLCVKDESSWLEFKAGMYAREEDRHPGENVDDNYWHIARAVIAFMNSSGGVIVIGIDDKNRASIGLSSCDPKGIIGKDGVEAYLRQEILDKLPPAKKSWTLGSKGTLRLREKGVIPLDQVIVKKATYQNKDVALVFVKPLPMKEYLLVQHDRETLLPIRRKGSVGQVIDLYDFDEKNAYLEHEREICKTSYAIELENLRKDLEAPSNYLAFISYNHHDQDFAKRLHEELLSFHIPYELRRQLGKDKPSEFSPIFLDEADAPAGEKLSEHIQTQLANSRNLIVICSPSSAVPSAKGKHWVDDEVRYFLTKHEGTRNIIPVIIEGQVGGGPGRECYCPALQELGDVLGIDATEKGHGMKYVTLHIAAKFLELKARALDDILRKNRHLRIAKCLFFFFLLSFIGFVCTVFSRGGSGIWTWQDVGRECIILEYPIAYDREPYTILSYYDFPAQADAVDYYEMQEVRVLNEKQKPVLEEKLEDCSLQSTNDKDFSAVPVGKYLHFSPDTLISKCDGLSSGLCYILTTAMNAFEKRIAILTCNQQEGFCIEVPKVKDETDYSFGFHQEVREHNGCFYLFDFHYPETVELSHDEDSFDFLPFLFSKKKGEFTVIILRRIECGNWVRSTVEDDVNVPDGDYGAWMTEYLKKWKL